jgi:hypothetical protein
MSRTLSYIGEKFLNVLYFLLSSSPELVVRHAMKVSLTNLWDDRLERKLQRKDEPKSLKLWSSPAATCEYLKARTHCIANESSTKRDHCSLIFHIYSIVRVALLNKVNKIQHNSKSITVLDRLLLKFWELLNLNRYYKFL